MITLWKHIKKLKKLSRINLCKTGTFKDTALKLFNDINVSLPEPQCINQMEAEWMLNCYRGGCCTHKMDTEGGITFN